RASHRPPDRRAKVGLQDDRRDRRRNSHHGDRRTLHRRPRRLFSGAARPHGANALEGGPRRPGGGGTRQVQSPGEAVCSDCRRQRAVHFCGQIIEATRSSKVARTLRVASAAPGISIWAYGIATVRKHGAYMIPLRDLFESHLTVVDLQRSMTFFGQTLGLELAEVFWERRGAVFLCCGGGQLGARAVGGGGGAPQSRSSHPSPPGPCRYI